MARYHESKRKHMDAHNPHNLKEQKPHHDTVLEHYAGMEPRRRQEMEDAGMIHEDHRAIANLPQEVMIKPYGPGYAYMPEVLDDTIHGIEKQVGFDDSQRRRNFVPKKV